jgi:hypothetical protein
LALQTADIPGTNLRPKAWTEFTSGAAPKMDFVIGLDAATYESDPDWPGQPVTAWWDYPVIGIGKKRTDPGIAAIQTLQSLRVRIKQLVNLHARGRSRADLQHDLRDITHV